MSKFSTDRNLLVGTLGLQMGLITDSQLIRAMQAWILRKNEDIESLLLEQEAIQVEAKDFLKALAERYLSLHQNDPTISLATLSSQGKLHEKLKDLGDDDVSISVTQLQSRSKIEVKAAEPSIENTITTVSSGAFRTDRFRVLRPHARGGLGQVSIAEDRELHREVALKEIQSPYVADQQSRSRFLMEAEITGRLEHPGIVPVYSLGTTESGAPFYTMRFIKGDSLKEAIEEFYSESHAWTNDQRRMALRRLVKRLVDVCNTIEYAHSRGVLHRDLKPGNIMLGKYGETLVVDWGLAKSGHKSPSHATSDEATVVPLSGDSSTQTVVGSVVGTPAFMSPEQAEGRLSDLGPASDVYCLGATLYCILTGQAPFSKLSPREIAIRVRNGTVTSPRKLNPNVPPALEAICKKAMAFEQTDRYPSAAALANELEFWLADEPVDAYPEPISKRVGRWIRKHRAFVTSSAVIAITSIIALAAFAIIIQRQNRELKTAYDRVSLAEESTRVERDAAILERDRAIRNLDVARVLAVSMLDKAESQLSKGDATPTMLIGVRSDLTELAFEKFRQLYESNTGNRDFGREYAKIARVSGNLKRTVRQLDTANERIRLSLQLQNLVPSEERSDAESDYLAETYRELATNLLTEGKLSEAEEAILRSMEIAEDLCRKHPDSWNYIRTQALARMELVSLETRRRRFDSAKEHSEANINAFSRLANSESPHPLDLVLAMYSREDLMQILLKSNRIPAATEAAQGTLSTIREKMTQKPDDIHLLQALSQILISCAEIELAASESLDQTVPKLNEAIEIIGNLKKAMRSASLIQNEAVAYCFKAEALRRNGNAKDAATAVQAARKLAENLVRSVDIAVHNFLMHQVELEESRILDLEGKSEDAREKWKQALASLTKAVEQSPDDVEYRERLNRFQNASEPTKAP